MDDFEKEKLKMLKLESTYNTRDLGGYKTFDGKATKYNVFLRSDNTHKLTEKDIETLKNYNVKTIVDLRKDKELLEKPSKLIDISGIKYYRVDIHGILYSHYGNNIKKFGMQIFLIHTDMNFNIQGKEIGRRKL